MKLILILLISITFSFSLTTEQVNKIKIAYIVGKNIKAEDGTTFEKTLVGILGQESSFGEYILGDAYDTNGALKSVYKSSLGGFQIKLSTAKLTIRKYPHLMKKYGHLLYNGDSIYLEYEKNKKKMDYYKSVLNNPEWLKRYRNGEKKAVDTMILASKNYNKHIKIHNSLMEKARKDTKLIDKLFTDVIFGATIAGHYLKLQYDYAILKDLSSPYKKAIGKYNGGWNNMEYANKVIERMKVIEDLSLN